jgi:hypothetical protein
MSGVRPTRRAGSGEASRRSMRCSPETGCRRGSMSRSTRCTSTAGSRMTRCCRWSARRWWRRSPQISAPSARAGRRTTPTGPVACWTPRRGARSNAWRARSLRSTVTWRCSAKSRTGCSGSGCREKRASRPPRTSRRCSGVWRPSMRRCSRRGRAASRCRSSGRTRGRRRRSRRGCWRRPASQIRSLRFRGSPTTLRPRWCATPRRSALVSWARAVPGRHRSSRWRVTPRCLRRGSPGSAPGSDLGANATRGSTG